jgi:hypothetical protein
MSNFHGTTADQQMLDPEGYKALHQGRESTGGETWPNLFERAQMITAEPPYCQAFFIALCPARLSHMSWRLRGLAGCLAVLGLTRRPGLSSK